MAKADRLARLYQRRASLDESAQIRAMSFAANTLDKEGEYLVESMQPIEAAYTEKTFETGERVRSQLKAGLPLHFSPEFDYQGSVTSDTHIRTYSDIDLLVMDGRFVSLDAGAPNPSPFQGNCLAEALILRQAASTVVKEKFPAVTINDKPGKSISLSGGSLARKIDVIVGNWWDTAIYKTYNTKVFRGIDIIDTKVPERIKNMPFLHNYRINERDKTTKGLRKAIRFLKTLKYDAEPSLSISSYDVTSLAYNMSDVSLSVTANSYVQLARNVTNELRRFIDNSATRDSLTVPNGTRKVFGFGAATLDQLKALHKEASELVRSVELAQAVQHSFSLKAANARPQPIWEETLPASVRANMY
jgi:hypothetical protein